MKKRTFRVEFRHPKAMHPKWGSLPENTDITLARARTVVRDNRHFESGKKGGFQQRIVRTTTTEAVVW